MYGLFLSTLAIVFVVAFWFSVSKREWRDTENALLSLTYPTVLTAFLIALAYAASEFIAFSMMASMMLPS